MARRRYYYCPNCRDTMLGWVSDLDGREHWVCVGHPPCGLGRRPNPQARPPLGRPNVGRPWGVLVEAEEPASPQNTSRSQGPSRRAAPTIHRSAVRGRLLWLLAAALAATVTAGVLRVGPFAASAPTSDRGPVLGPGFVGGPAGPQYNGFRVVCRDGWISYSGGRPGACSHHGGEP